jgi:hypothetical protein
MLETIEMRRQRKMDFDRLESRDVPTGNVITDAFDSYLGGIAASYATQTASALITDFLSPPPKPLPPTPVFVPIPGHDPFLDYMQEVRPITPDNPTPYLPPSPSPTTSPYPGVGESPVRPVQPAPPPQQ